MRTSGGIWVWGGIGTATATATALAGALAVGSLGAGGCSSNGNGVTLDVDAGGDDASTSLDGGDAADAGARGDAAADAAVDGAASANVGRVFATSDTDVVDGGAIATHAAGAAFFHVDTADATHTTKTVGPCVVEKFGSGQEADTAVSAGALHMTGGTSTIDIAPSSTKEYATKQGDGVLWNGGETLTVTAAGADVPAFTVSLAAPAKVTLVMPAITAATQITVPRNAPWNATWTGASSGTVVLYFDTQDATSAYSATCAFDASAGSAVVPAAAFADFPAGSGTFEFYVKQAAAPVVAGWDLLFTASSSLVTDAGIAANGATTYP